MGYFFQILGILFRDSKHQNWLFKGLAPIFRRFGVFFPLSALSGTNGVQEAARSNLATPTIETKPVFLVIARETGFFFLSFSGFYPLIYPLQVFIRHFIGQKRR